MIHGVHHINFLVRDLEVARERFSRLLRLEFAPPVELAARGALTSRARAGTVWIVLVQPTRADSVPGRRLAEHGEGLFLISFAVDDLDAAIDAVATNGGTFSTPLPRAGLDGWKIIDLAPELGFGAEVQFCEAPDPPLP